MEKMRATFYVLAVLGALLGPLLAETEISNTTGAFTTTRTLQNLNPVDKNSSVDVSNATKAYDNTTRVENSSSQMPPVEETNTMMKTANVHTTTKMKDVHTTAKDTRPITKAGITTTKLIPAPTDSHAETPRTSPVYVIVLIIVILSVAVIGIIFFCVKSNRKRFSVDIHAKHEDAQIPLASVKPETFDNSPKGTDLKSFTYDEASPTDRLENTEQKAIRPNSPTHADQQVTESPAKSQTTETPAEKSSELIVVDDADPIASTKTSVETLNDVLNENNSNNNAVRDVGMPFKEICLND